MYKNWTDAQREQTSEPLLVKLLKKQVLVSPPPPKYISRHNWHKKFAQFQANLNN